MCNHCTTPSQCAWLEYLTLLVICFQTKMSLQLYQVDQKSFLLDFKSLLEHDGFDSLHGVSSMTSQGSIDTGINLMCTSV